MTHPARFSVSLLDLLTCGMGGVLLMFMMVLAVAERFQITPDFSEQRVQEPLPESPFVLLVAVDPKLQPDGHPAQQPLELNVEQWAGCTLSSGPGHAVVYARRPPPIEARVVLRPGDLPPSLRVWVFHEGQGRSIGWASSTTGQSVQIWPPTQEGLPSP